MRRIKDEAPQDCYSPRGPIEPSGSSPNTTANLISHVGISKPEIFRNGKPRPISDALTAVCDLNPGSPHDSNSRTLR
jgi:hypothetical protein